MKKSLLLITIVLLLMNIFGCRKATNSNITTNTVTVASSKAEVETTTKKVIEKVTTSTGEVETVTHIEIESQTSLSGEIEEVTKIVSEEVTKQVVVTEPVTKNNTTTPTAKQEISTKASETTKQQSTTQAVVQTTTKSTTQATTTTQAPTTTQYVAPTEPPHIHSFSEANCWNAATCSCGATNGNALGHDFGDNNTNCSRCGTTNPNYVAPEPTKEDIIYEAYDSMGREQMNTYDKFLQAFLDGFNEARAEKGYPPITYDMLIPGMMEGSQQWSDEMAKLGYHTHGDDLGHTTDWMDPFTTTEYSKCVEGVDSVKANFSYSSVNAAGWLMAEHVGAFGNKNNILYMGIGITFGWKDNSFGGQKAVYVCVNTIVHK